MAGSYGFSISCGWGVYSSIYACVMWTENTASNGKQDIFVCVWVASVRMFEADRGEREGGGEGEKSSGYMHFLKATWMSSCFLLICALKTSVSPHLWQTSVLIHVTVCFAYFLCVFFDTSLCVHRWMWTYLTVVGVFFFYSFISLILFEKAQFCFVGVV